MNFSLVYIVGRFFFRIKDFFRNWYFIGFRNIAHFFVSILESLDKFFALKVNLKNLFQPLYQDYSFLGRVLGFTFRSLRILIALVLYPLVLIAGVLVYLFWAAIPLFVIYKGFR